MKNFVYRLSHPNAGMLVLFCFAIIFALLAMPLQQTRTSAQNNKHGAAMPPLVMISLAWENAT